MMAQPQVTADGEGKGQYSSHDTLRKVLAISEKHYTRFAYASVSGSKVEVLEGRSVDSLITQQRLDSMQKDKRGICIIENISPQWILALTKVWDIGDIFFAEHASGPALEHVWEHQQPSSSQGHSHAQNRHIYGVYEYHGLTNPDAVRAGSANYCQRHFFLDSKGAVNSSTTLSYCCFSQGFYLFLVDPLAQQHSSAQGPRPWATSLRFPYSGNRGGLFIPSLIDETTSLYHVLKGMLFDHFWHIKLLCSKLDPFPPVEFLYLMSCSAIETNCRELSKRVNDISFNEIRRPRWDITDRLHDLRKELHTLQLIIKEAEHYIPSKVEQYFQASRTYAYEETRSGTMETPGTRLRALMQRTSETQMNVSETFNILIGTMAVLDSMDTKKQTEESLKQTRQSVLLTGLATVYLPLSLATSIYGMNLQEMTGIGPRIWTFVVTVIALITTTLVIFAGLFWNSLAARLQLSKRQNKPLRR